MRRRVREDDVLSNTGGMSVDGEPTARLGRPGQGGIRPEAGKVSLKEARQARPAASVRLAYRAGPAYDIILHLLPAREGSDAFPSMETARVHHPAWRCGCGVAAYGTSAAAGKAGRRVSV